MKSLKYYLPILLGAMLSLSPAWAAAPSQAEEASAEAAFSFVPGSTTLESVGENVTLKFTGNACRVQGAAGLTLEVYSLTGAKVATVPVDANDKTITLNLSRGWYIVKVGPITRKIAIQ